MVGKSEIAQQVAQRAGIPRTQAMKAVNALVDVVQESLAKNDSVSITGFGSWRVTETKARKGRNPRTGQSIEIKAGRRVSFRPGSGLSQSVRADGKGGGRGGRK
jgi:DNA-binding protein HU-beta